MSKFLPDPQIQQLKAMRAGDIALVHGPTNVIGKTSSAFVSPFANIAVAPVATPGQGTVVGTFNENPTIGEATATTLSQDAAISVPMVATPATEPLAGTPSETPVIGVATSTSVV